MGSFSMRASVNFKLGLQQLLGYLKPLSCHKPKGLRAPLSCPSQARYGIGWGVIGAAMDCHANDARALFRPAQAVH